MVRDFTAPSAAATVFVLCLSASVAAQTRLRPISDFVSQQGTYCPSSTEGCTVVPGCCLYVPPVGNYMGWTDPKRLAFGCFDYAGVAASYLRQPSHGGLELGTTFEGVVSEDRLPDGRGFVTVLLRTTNALAWAAPTYEGPRTFGFLASEVQAGKRAVLGTCHLHAVFVTKSFGGPLPNLCRIAFEPAAGENLLYIQFDGSATGPLRAASGYGEGTPGSMRIMQLGLLFLVGKIPHFDGFPVERVEVRKT